jgi:hypothetical protein
MKKLDFLKVSFIVRKDRMQNDKGPVYLQLFLDGKRVRISTDQLVNMKDWDEKSGRLKGNSAMSNSINEYLEKIKLDTLRIYNDYKLKEVDITVDMLKNRLTKKEIDQRKKAPSGVRYFSIQMLKSSLVLKSVKSPGEDTWLLETESPILLSSNIRWMIFI